MQCDEIMKSDVETISEESTIQEAAGKMAAANVGFLPICDSAGKVLGTITDRDIAVRAVAKNKLPADTKVGEVMTHEVIACRPGDALGVAEQAMADHHKSRVLVTDLDGFLIGVISLSDIAEKEQGRRAAITLRHVASRETRT
jgi:CBS domain-containing protein